VKVWRSLNEFPAAAVPYPVFTIGNFDGVHIGHRKLLGLVRERAAQHGGTSLVLTFEPHPLRIVSPQRAPRLITPLDLKLELLEAQGVDGVVVLPFTREFSRLEPSQFARDVLAHGLHAREVVVGENFRFGHRHAGDVRALEHFGTEMGFHVHAVGPVRLRGEMVSSSRIRQLVSTGNVSMAHRLLGHCFRVQGAIVPGRQIGRRQTVPTLNLGQYDELLPGRGVYITETVCDGVQGRSVTNVGTSPTFDGTELKVETFMLDAVPPPHAAEMEVIFYRRIRDEVRFPTAEALKQQIIQDVETANRFFRRLKAIRPPAAR